MNSTLAWSFGRFFLVCSKANFLANSRTNSCTLCFFWKFSTRTEMAAREIGIILFEDVVLMMIHPSTLTGSRGKLATIHTWKSSSGLTEKKLRENGIATDENIFYVISNSVSRLDLIGISHSQHQCRTKGPGVCWSMVLFTNWRQKFVKLFYSLLNLLYFLQ